MDKNDFLSNHVKVNQFFYSTPTQLQSLMTLLCHSYVKWDSHWRPAGKPYTTLGTLELMLPWIGSWAIWMIQVCRHSRPLPESKWSINLTAPLSILILFSIWCRLLGPSRVTRLQLRSWDNTHGEPLWRAPGNYRFHGLQPRPGNQST